MLAEMTFSDVTLLTEVATNYSQSFEPIIIVDGGFTLCKIFLILLTDFSLFSSVKITAIIFPASRVCLS